MVSMQMTDNDNIDFKRIYVATFQADQAGATAINQDLLFGSL
jgi:hypothetical protein